MCAEGRRGSPVYAIGGFTVSSAFFMARAGVEVLAGLAGGHIG